jgi:hypothetical protein
VITKEDQARIDFAQKLLDSGKLKAVRFNSPAFLSCAVQHGLLKGTASLEDAYGVFGKLLISETLRSKRMELGMIGAIESLTPAELLSVRESLAGVVPFHSAKR